MSVLESLSGLSNAFSGFVSELLGPDGEKLARIASDNAAILSAQVADCFRRDEQFRRFKGGIVVVLIDNDGIFQHPASTLRTPRHDYIRVELRLALRSLQDKHKSNRFEIIGIGSSGGAVSQRRMHLVERVMDATLRQLVDPESEHIDNLRQVLSVNVEIRDDQACIATVARGLPQRPILRIEPGRGTVPSSPPMTASFNYNMPRLFPSARGDGSNGSGSSRSSCSHSGGGIYKTGGSGGGRRDDSGAGDSSTPIAITSPCYCAVSEDVLYGRSVSTYPDEATTNIIADSFAGRVYRAKNKSEACLLSIADGCNWGLWPALASQAAIAGILEFTERSVPLTSAASPCPIRNRGGGAGGDGGGGGGGSGGGGGVSDSQRRVGGTSPLKPQYLFGDEGGVGGDGGNIVHGHLAEPLFDESHAAFSSTPNSAHTTPSTSTPTPSSTSPPFHGNVTTDTTTADPLSTTTATTTTTSTTTTTTTPPLTTTTTCHSPLPQADDSLAAVRVGSSQSLEDALASALDAPISSLSTSGYSYLSSSAHTTSSSSSSASHTSSSSLSHATSASAVAYSVSASPPSSTSLLTSAPPPIPMTRPEKNAHPYTSVDHLASATTATAIAIAATTPPTIPTATHSPPSQQPPQSPLPATLSSAPALSTATATAGTTTAGTTTSTTSTTAPSPSPSHYAYHHTQDYAQLLADAILHANQSIIQRHNDFLQEHQQYLAETPCGTTTLLAGFVLPQDTLAQGPRPPDEPMYPFFGVFGGVGDCKAYRFTRNRPERATGGGGAYIKPGGGDGGGDDGGDGGKNDNDDNDDENDDHVADVWWSRSEEDDNDGAAVADDHEWQIFDITPASRPDAFESSDPGGRLGIAEPDLRNFQLSLVPLRRGDVVVLMTDGIHDNLDPVATGQRPSEFGLESWDDLKELPPWAMDSFKEKVALNILKKHNATTPKQVVDTLINFAYELTETSRTFLQDHPSSRLPDDFVRYPGKVDHASCLAYIVGGKGVA